MNEQIDNSGPAFPVHPKAHECGDLEYAALRGMTLRDYFAAKAMQGDWAAQSLATTGVFHLDGSDFPLAAKTYYAMADAMLAARSDA